MKLPKFKKKFVAGALAAGVVMGAGGIAAAYFSGTGAGGNTGHTTVGSSVTWAVSTVTAGPGTLYPGGTGVAVTSATVKNTGGGNQAVTNISITLWGAGLSYSGGAGTCTNTEFELSATPSSGWVLGTTSSWAKYVYSTPVVVKSGHFIVNGSTSASTGNALPGGLSVKMVTTGTTQDGCIGASVHLQAFVNPVNG